MWDTSEYIQRLHAMLDWQLDSEAIRCQLEIDRYGSGIEREKKRFINAERNRRTLNNCGMWI